jgi:N-acetylglucosamine kinase-like BadF-type ATPase
MKLFIDSGATKSEFLVVEQEKILFRFITSGINANYCDDFYIQNILIQFKTSFEKEFSSPIDSVRYYGAGCMNSANSERVSRIIKELFPHCKVEVFSDILAVCHALYGTESGYAGILGTGSVGCFYNGKEIVEIAPSLGYLLGDEGSGFYLGKLFLQDYLKGLWSDHILNAFEKEFECNRNMVVRKIYRDGNPQHWISSIAPFIEKMEGSEEIQSLILLNFDLFFEHQLSYLKNGASLWRISGSIGFHFAPFVLKSAQKHGILIDKIIKSPLEKIIEQNKI